MKKTFLFSLVILALGFVFGALAQTALATDSFQYHNPLINEVTSFSDWFGNLLVNIQGVVGWLAVIMIVIGGVVYITSGGSVRQATLGKTIVVFAMVGFAIAVAAPSLLREVRDIAAGGGGPGSDLIGTARPLSEVIAHVMLFVITAIGMLAVIGFVIGGVLYISAGGDSSKAEKGKKAVVYSVIAIAISGGAVIILRQVIAILETTNT